MMNSPPRLLPRRALRLAVAPSLCALALWGGAATAHATPLRFCPVGSGAGQCLEQSGVATDFETERLYVADKGNNRIDVFEANGTFLFAFGWKVDASNPEEKLQTCTIASGCLKGSAGAGDGQFKGPRRVAVDNDSVSGSHHDVYVFDSGNLRVQKFDPSGVFLKKREDAGSGTGPGEFKDEVDLITVSPSGKFYVSDMPQPSKEPRIEVFDGELNLLEEFKLEREERLNNGLAVDSSGDIYAVFNQAVRIFKFHPGGSAFGSPWPLESETIGLAIGAQDQLFAGEGEGRAGKGPFPAGKSEFPAITEYTPAGAYLERFGYGLGFGTAIETFSGLAVLHSAAPNPLRSGDVFAGLNKGTNRIAYAPMPPPGPVVAPLSLEAPEEGNTKARIAGEVNPEGAKPTKYHFEYVDLHSFETEGGFSSPNKKTTPEAEVTIKSGTAEEKDLFSLHAAEAQIGCTEPLSEAGHPGETEIEAGNCLAPETEYVFRLVATNPEGSAEGEIEPVLGRFTTKAGLEIKETWASEPTTEGARLSAKLNALGIPATGFFEYVDQETCEADEEAGGSEEHCFDHAHKVPDVDHGQSPLDFGSSESSVRSVTLTGLAPGRGYRYRVVATDELLALQDASVPGPAHTLRPFVKPSQAPCANEEFRSGAGGLLADCRAYEMVSPLDKNNADIVPFGEFSTGAPAALNESATSGEKVSYTTGTPFGDTVSAPYSPTYIAVRNAAAKEWQSHSIDSPHEEPDVTLLNQLNTEFKLFSPDLCEAWQRTVAEPPLSGDAVLGYPNIYRRTDQSCGGGPDYEAITTLAPPDVPRRQYGELALQGTSADGRVALYAAPDNLADGAGGEPAQPASCRSEGKECRLRLYEKRPGEGPKFVCLGPLGEGIGPCEAGSGGGGGSGFKGNEHNAISADGEDVYWTGAGRIYLRVGGTQTQAVSAAGEALSGTSSSRFLAASEDGSKAVFVTEKGGGVADLYLYDAASEATTPIAHEALGLAGMSEDGRRIYFASSEALTGGEENSAGGKAQAEEPNLYLDEEGAIRFVMTLGSGDFSGAFHPVNLTEPIAWMSRLDANGGTLAFVSTAFAPTGYDNTDATSPEECGEGRPEGICDAEVYRYEAEAEGGQGRLACVSCNPSGARPAGTNIGRRISCGCNPLFFAAAEIAPWENNLYASRALSANGRRLFFEAADALTPLDTNGVTDVYEWEAAGEGSCREGSPDYAPSSGGCVDLISSGKSGRDATFLDADSKGENVFFTTLSSLVPQDYGLVDVYDARQGGGLPPPSQPKVPCEGEACQSPPAAPNDPTPASEAFRGAGNVLEGGPRPKCAKGKVRRRSAEASKPSKSDSSTQRAKRDPFVRRCVKHKPHKHRRHARRGRGRR